LTLRPRVKICCISSLDEVRIAVEAGADALGFVGPMPSGPGTLEADQIPRLVAAVPPGISRFLLTAHTDAASIVQATHSAGVDTVQLVDATTDDTLDAVRRALPSVRIVQVIHVCSADDVDLACRLAPRVDALLLDSGNPNAKVKTLGGTGQTHDWRLSRQIVDAADCPVFLAGGLRAENVADGVAQVAPFGLDVCSGVRVDGRLDGRRLARFIAAVRETTAH